MQNAKPNLFTRDDTLLGVCEGLGEDLGFNPLWLRLALTLALFFNPVATMVGYLSAGAVVLATRLLFPAPRPAEAAEAVAEAEELVGAEAEADQRRLPLAA